MRALRTFFRRLRSLLLTTLAVACILAAVAVGLARLSMPMVSNYQPDLEAWLSERVGQPVEVESVTGRWSARGPVVRVSDMRVIDPGGGADALRINQAEIYFDIVDWVMPGRRPNRFRILGGEWSVRRLEDGRMRVEGLGSSGGSGATGKGGLGLLFRQGTIEVQDTRIHFADDASGLENTIEGIDLVLNNTGNRHLLQLNIPAPGEGSGNVEVRLEAFGHPAEGQVSRVLVYLKAEDVDLAVWSRGVQGAGVDLLNGVLDTELWGELHSARLAGLIGQVQVKDLVAAARTTVDTKNVHGDTLAVAPRYAADSLAASVNWQDDGAQWQLALDDIAVDRNARQWPQSAWLLRGTRADGEQPARVMLGADFLRIQDLADLAVLTHRLPAAIRSAMYQSAPSGELRALKLAADLPAMPADTGTAANPATNNAPRIAAGAVFENLSVLSHGNTPGVSGLSGKVTANPERVHVRLDSEGFLVTVPPVFKRTLPALNVDGDVYLRRRENGPGWIVEAPELAMSGSGFSARSRFLVDFNGGNPYIDASVDVREGNMRAATAFLPDAQWDAQLVNWLRSALISGRVTSAGALIHGDLDDWPFAEGEGSFITRIHAEDGQFEFSPDWPPLHGADATIEVIGNSLRVNGRGGQLLGGDIIEATAVIPNLRKAILSVSGQARGRVADFREVIRQSPLESMLAQYFNDLDISGDGRLSLGLRIPMTGSNRHISVDGKVALSNATVLHSAWSSEFEQVTGDVVFSERGFTTRGVSAQMNGQPVDVELEVGPEFAPTGLTLMAYITGAFEPLEILSGYPTLMPVAAVASGRSRWTALLTSPREADGKGLRRTHMTLTSELEGTEVKLPAPLGKSSEQVLPLTLSIDFPFQGGEVELVYGDRGRANARALPDGSITAGVLHFGEGIPTPVPEEGIRIEGNLEALDAAGWVALVGAVGDATGDSGTDTAARLLESMDLQVDKLTILGRQFADAALSLSRSEQHWHASVAAAGLKGEVRLPATDDASQTVVAEFSELVWPAVEAQSDPVTLDPRNLPSLQLFVEHLELYGVDLGEALLQTYPTSDGLHVERLEANSLRMELRAKGDWRMSDSGPVSDFAINLISESMGDMLSSFGFIDAVHGGQTIARLQAQWPGAPVDFKLANVEGNLQVSVSNGRIPEAELGAGRILGLLSLNAIPRRLALDFSDLFESGLGFDSIEGSFDLRRGEAWTDDFSIKGPAMDIFLSGRTGLVSQEYDQVMIVVPKVGVTFPIVGALAAGPGGAAAGFLLSNIFSSAIDDMSQFQYTVTGPWEDPQIELRGAVAASGTGTPSGS